MIRLLSYAGCAVALAAAPAQAQSVFIANLSGANENPPISSPGRGVALVLFDSASQTMIVRMEFSGLTGSTADGHIHCCTVPTGNAGVAFGLTSTGFPLGVTSGQYGSTLALNNAGTFTSSFVAANGGTAASASTAFIDATRGGLAYFNVHTTSFPGGELRGHLVTSPQLTPEAYSLLPEVTMQTAEFQDSAVRRYLRDARSAVGRPNGQTATLGSDGEIGMFLIGGARFGEFEGDTNRPRVDLESTGVIAGLDYRFGPRMLLGVMGGYDSSDARLTSNSRQSQVKSWFGGIYGSGGFGPAHFDLHASYGKSNYDLFRGISISSFNAESEAEADSEQWMVAGTAGISLEASGIEIEPYVGARYVNLKLGAFTETGHIAALTIDASKAESLQSIAGLRMGADIPVGRLSVRPSVSAEWRHEFKNDDLRLITGSFGGVAPFAFSPTPLGDDHAAIGAGLSISDGGPLSLSLDYSGELGGGYNIHSLNGAVRLTF